MPIPVHFLLSKEQGVAVSATVSCSRLLPFDLVLDYWIGRTLTDYSTPLYVISSAMSRPSNADEIDVKRQKLLTVRDVAEWLNMSTGWVRDHATGRRGPVPPSVKLGKALRFREDEVEAWLRELSRQYAV